MAFDKWDKRFINLAFEIASWSSCYQDNRKVGAVIVREKRILTTGYNGAPAGLVSCVDKGECMRRVLNIPSGTKHELCYAIHAEQNAVIQAAKMGVSIDGATLYCTHQPCAICSKILINAGIKKIIFKEPYPDEFALKLLNEANVALLKYEDE